MMRFAPWKAALWRPDESSREETMELGWGSVRSQRRRDYSENIGGE